jgi:hypothetical protein
MYDMRTGKKGETMKRCILIALTIVLWFAAIDTADANHAEPRPIQPFASAFFFGADGMIHNVVHSNTSDEDNYVFGWIWDENDPDHTWQAVDSIFEHTGEMGSFGDNTFTRFSKFHLYNSSRVTLAQTNKKIVRSNPNFAFGAGPDIELFDHSKLIVDDSYIGNVFADGESSVTIKNTIPSGTFIMQSHGEMTLNGISPGFDRFGFPQGMVIARSGTTDISASTLTNIRAEDSGKVTMMGGVITGDVTCTGDDSATPHVALDGTHVQGSLHADAGSLALTSGIVDGSVTANDGTISLSGGQVTGNLNVVNLGTANMSGVQLLSGITALGHDSTALGAVNMAGGSVKKLVVAGGNATVTLSNLSAIEGGLEAESFGAISVTGTSTIVGDVRAKDNSHIGLSSVTNITGNVIVSGSVKLDLFGTSVLGTLNASGESGTLRMLGGDVQGSAISFQSGTIELNGVAVTGSVQALDHSRLRFDVGSHARQDVQASGTSRVDVLGGTINSNLVGSGSSITAMSGGHVVGFPVFIDHATFAYSGGTFDFFGIPQGGGAASLRALASGAGGENSLLPGFTAMDDAEIQFIGFGLQSTLVDPNFDSGRFSLYRLTGRLADGTVVDGGSVYVQNQTTARFQLVEATVPEPGGAALVVLAALLVVAKRRSA